MSSRRSELKKNIDIFDKNHHTLLPKIISVSTFFWRNQTRSQDTFKMLIWTFFTESDWMHSLSTRSRLWRLLVHFLLHFLCLLINIIFNAYLTCIHLYNGCEKDRNPLYEFMIKKILNYLVSLCCICTCRYFEYSFCLLCTIGWVSPLNRNGFAQSIKILLFDLKILHEFMHGAK